MLLVPLLILIFFFGLEMTIILGMKINFPERLAISFLLGIGLSTYIVFLLALVLGVNFSLVNTFIILFSLCAVCLTIKLKEIINFFKNIKLRKITIKPKTAVFWGFILIVFVYTLFVNSVWPITDWDSLALYDFRAKVFLVDTNLVHAARENYFYFAQYPLLTSLSHLFVYQVGVNNPKFIYSLFYLSFIIIFYYSIRKNVSENKSLFFTLILVLVPEIFSHATMAYTNLAYVVYLCSGIFYLYFWIKKKERSYLFLSAILVGLSIWVRIMEVFWMVPLFVLFIYAFKEKKWGEFIYYLVITVAIYYSWKFFMDPINRMSTPLTSGRTLVVMGLPIGVLKKISFEKIRLTIEYLYKYVLSSWGLIFLVFFIVAIRNILFGKKNINILLCVILLFFTLVFGGTLAFSVYYPWWQDIGESAGRMSMFLIPMMIFYLSLQI